MDQELEVDDMPYPLRQAYIKYDEEKEDFKKLHRLLDAIEVLVKLHTVIILSDYFSRNEPSEMLKGLLAAGLKRPSLGIWWQFARDVSIEMQTQETPFFAEGIEKIVRKKGRLNEAMQGEENLIAFRNRYAHGATPPDEECRADFEKYERIFLETLLQATHFGNLAIVGLKEDGQSIFPRVGEGFSSASQKLESGDENAGKCFLLRKDGARLSLHPLLFLRSEVQLGTGKKRPGFFFYNDLREKEANMLEYENCWHWRDEILHADLMGSYPIDRWKKHTDSEIQATIDRLTESFKGRVREVNQLMEFIARPEGGTMMAWGGPGIGKSALLARLVQALSWSSEERRNENFTGLGTVEKVQVVRYFIRRSGQTNDAEKMLHHLNEELEKFAKTKLQSGRSIREMSDSFRERLRRAKENLRDDQRLVILVDGLDEGSDAKGLLDSLPREVPEKVALIYASREIPEVRSRIWENLDRERRTEMTVNRMGVEEVRALLFDFVDKYRMEEKYVSKVLNTSEGNPLYLKLLCRGLERGDYKLNDALGLPTEIKNLYEDMVKRYAKEYDRTVEYLCLLAQAKFFLSDEVAAELIGCTQHEMEKILSVCRDCLYENPYTENLDDYQLFHESMREYLLDTKSSVCEKWKQKLAEWCDQWKSREKSELSRDYAVKFGVAHALEWRDHLRKSRRIEEASEWESRILAIVENGEFRRELFLRCGHAETMRNNIMTAQGILLRQGGVNERQRNRTRVLKLARIYQEEPITLYGRLLEELEEAGKDGDFEKVAERAQAGINPKQKTMLALRGAWGVKGMRRENSLALKTKLENWLESAEDEDLNRLVVLGLL